MRENGDKVPDVKKNNMGTVNSKGYVRIYNNFKIEMDGSFLKNA